MGKCENQALYLSQVTSYKTLFFKFLTLVENRVSANPTLLPYLISIKQDNYPTLKSLNKVIRFKFVQSIFSTKVTKRNKVIYNLDMLIFTI